MAYVSTSRALAVLEFLVHAPREFFPPDRILIPIEIPDELVAEPARVPRDWKTAQRHARALGDGWIHAGTSLALLVPSAVLTKENNVLITPAHSEFPRIRVHRPETDFLSDAERHGNARPSVSSTNELR